MALLILQIIGGIEGWDCPQTAAFESLNPFIKFCKV